MKADILEVLKNICEAMGIQVLFLRAPYANVTELDFGLGSKLYKNYDYTTIFQTIEKTSQPNTVYHIENPFSMYYTFFRFPDAILNESGYTLCCIGPILFTPFDKIDLSSIMEKHQLDDHQLWDLQTFYSQIPTLPSPDYWINIITPLCRMFFKQEIDLIWAHISEEDVSTISFDAVPIQPDPTLRLETIEKRYAAENAMLNAIRRGDSTEAIILYNHFLQYKLRPRASDPLRDTKNLLFVANTLFRKAVEQANVHPSYIDDLSRRFAIQIEQCTSPHQLNQLNNEMIRKYCLLVNNFSRKDVSDLTHRCLDYIDFHYAESLSLASLAKQLSVSSTYLSALFKKEMGINITSYIQDARLRQALLLLNSTKLPIQEIAAQCGFLDENYFSRVFKKVHGMSPRDYRKQVRSL